MVDERTNALIISDIPKKLQPLDQLISTLDAETPQVMIEARIVETSKTFAQDLGVKWGFNAIADASTGTGTGLKFPANASAKYGLNLPGNGSASTLAFSFGNILDSFTLDIALSDLETEGRGRILSSPKIATQNNERAEIEQRCPYSRRLDDGDRDSRRVRLGVAPSGGHSADHRGQDRGHGRARREQLAGFR